LSRQDSHPKVVGWNVRENKTSLRIDNDSENNNKNQCDYFVVVIEIVISS
jgi:hypothetical protein